MTHITLSLDGHETNLRIDVVIIAGWTGRDRAAVEEHIAELEALGVPRPSTVPVFYRVPASRLTTAQEIEATQASSGEVEPVLLHHDAQLWVGVGSDHTDREVETYSVALSKQVCDKPIALRFWPYENVVAHWDQLVLRSWSDSDSVYQEDTLSSLMHPDELLALARPPLGDGTLMFCGTIAAMGGIRPSPLFRYQLEDPVMGGTLDGSYRMRPLPLIN